MSCLPVWRGPDDLVKEWIGHSNLRITADYTHFTDDFRQKIASDFGLVRADMVPIPRMMESTAMPLSASFFCRIEALGP
jgi:hypothetical protein